MKKNEIQQLIDRFLEGTTTLDEERQLADYFRTASVPDEWSAYKEMFAYFDAGMPNEAMATEAAAEDRPLVTDVQAAPRRIALLRRWAVAAAIALMAAAGIWVVRNGLPTQPQQAVSVSKGPQAVPQNGGLEQSVLTASADTLGGSQQTDPVESRIATEQSGGAKAIEAHCDSMRHPTPDQPKRESMKYRFEPATPKTYLAEADYEELGDSVNRVAQMMAQESLRDVEQRQQTYFEAIQFVSAVAAADVAAMSEEEELY